jgi:hypothetical protein
LPAFTGGSSEKFRIAPNPVQIDTTLFCPQRHAKSAFSGTHLALNRTAVILHCKITKDFTRRGIGRGLSEKPGSANLRSRPRISAFKSVIARESGRSCARERNLSKEVQVLFG